MTTVSILYAKKLKGFGKSFKRPPAKELSENSQSHFLSIEPGKFSKEPLSWRPTRSQVKIFSKRKFEITTILAPKL